MLLKEVMTVPVMLVEDDEVDIQNLKRAFNKLHIAQRLYIAKDGNEAMDKLLGRSNQIKLNPLPKIILLDINLPKINGLEFLEELRNSPEFNSILVYILTTSNHEKDKLAAYRCHIAGYILKPMELTQYMNTINLLTQYWDLLEFPK